MQFPTKMLHLPRKPKLVNMLLRLLILVFLWVSMSGCEMRRDIEIGSIDVDSCGAILQDDSDDMDAIRCCNWFGIVSANDAPVLRTVGKQRTTQRVLEKRRLLWDTLVRFSFVNTTLKHFAHERQQYCYLIKSGRSLLYFLCKLSI